MKVTYKTTKNNLPPQVIEGSDLDVLARLDLVRDSADDMGFEIEILAVEMTPEEQKTAFECIFDTYEKYE